MQNFQHAMPQAMPFLLQLSGARYFWLLIVVAGMALLVAWHAENFAYICPKCGAVFEISGLKDFLGPNSITKKYLKCPKCKKRAWAETVSYTHLRAHETPEHLVCRLLLA